MLRRLAGGEPVEFYARMISFKGLTRLAFLAEQFGYAYADLRQGEQGFTLYLVPDSRPRARELAAENRDRYPRAAEGGPLPVPDPAALALLKARMLSDLRRRYSLKQLLWMVGVSVVLAALDFGMEFGDGRESVLTIASAVWAGFVVLLVLLHLWSRRVARTNAAFLEAAGFTLAPDERGRLRHVPPDEATT